LRWVRSVQSRKNDEGTIHEGHTRKGATGPTDSGEKRGLSRGGEVEPSKGEGTLGDKGVRREILWDWERSLKPSGGREGGKGSGVDARGRKKKTMNQRNKPLVHERMLDRDDE